MGNCLRVVILKVTGQLCVSVLCDVGNRLKLAL